MDLTLDKLKDYKHIHLIGIGGISMSSVAEILKNWGFTVTGSDSTQSDITDKLVYHDIPVVIGHDLENCKKADLIVYTAAIPDTDPEMVLAKENNIPLVPRGKFVGLITQKYSESICVSGTHGKTTTTSMISDCFINAGKDPTIQVGAILNELDGNYRIGNSEFFILESCEYKESFLEFFPNTGIILNIDNDHLDYYKTFDNVIKAFTNFAKIVEKDKGTLITNADDPNCYNLKNVVNCKVITYGIDNKDADFRADNISYDKNGFPTFDVYKGNDSYGKVKLSVAGIHNVLNALATIATCDLYGIEKEVVISSLSKFVGASRRLEIKGTLLAGSVKIFDDYAHHPTEIAATARAVKNKTYNESWVVFQPHTYSRTKEHLHAFAEALNEFDHIILLDIYAARETNTYGISSKDLNDEINKLSPDKSVYMPDFEEVVEYVKANIKEDDLVITLGAGTVTKIGPMLLD